MRACIFLFELGRRQRKGWGWKKILVHSCCIDAKADIRPAAAQSSLISGMDMMRQRKMIEGVERKLGSGWWDVKPESKEF